MTYTLSGGSAHPFSEFLWIPCPPFALILEAHGPPNIDKREKESVGEKRLKKERKYIKTC